MTTKKILLIGGIGFLTYLLFKKSNTNRKNTTPGALEKFTTGIAHSIIKPLDEVAEDVPTADAVANYDS